MNTSTMNQSSEKPSKPWYRYWLVWMMLSIPFSAVIMGVVMMTLAIETDDGLVADDYYKQGLGINQVISRDKKSAELGITAQIAFDNNAKTFQLSFDKGQLKTYPQQLHLQLEHATRANSDVEVILEHGIADQYIGYLKQPLSKGIWYFDLSEDDWKLESRVQVTDENMIHLQSKY